MSLKGFKICQKYIFLNNVPINIILFIIKLSRQLSLLIASHFCKENHDSFRSQITMCVGICFFNRIIYSLNPCVINFILYSINFLPGSLVNYLKVKGQRSESDTCWMKDPRSKFFYNTKRLQVEKKRSCSISLKPAFSSLLISNKVDKLSVYL